MAKHKTPKADRLPLGKFLAWKSSDITSAGVFLIINTYMALFCTDYLGMTPLAVGNIILISNIIDFFTDLIAAYVIDNTKTKWGKARPYELGAIGMTICTTLIFVTPAGWSDTLKVIWVFCMYTFECGVFGTMRTAANVPYLIRAFDNNRTLIGKVSSYGGFVTTMGSMVVSLTFPKMMAKLASSDGGWTTLILIYMIPLTILGALRFLFVKENPSIDAQQVRDKVSMKDIWTMIKKNNYAWLYMAIMFLFQTIQSTGALAYYFKYIVGDEGSAGGMECGIWRKRKKKDGSRNCCRRSRRSIRGFWEISCGGCISMDRWPSDASGGRAVTLTFWRWCRGNSPMGKNGSCWTGSCRCGRNVRRRGWK